MGAGPGDPGLITVAGLQALRHAEVVVYDALANPCLLDEAPADAELVDAGKRAKAHRLSQDQTNALMRDKALQGKRVVRLKGGDPYLFGRGAEEAAFLASHGVDVDVVPGITSGIAAPAYAGIPVTHRAHASSVTFLTGHEDPSKPDYALDYHALAGLVKTGGTLCVYMGVGRLPQIAETLVGFGVDPNTPAAAVRWGTTPRQQHVRATLDTLHDAIERGGLGPPAIVVIGAVAGLDQPGLDFFIKRPLLGKRIVITRTRKQASRLRERLEAHGAEVLEAPTIAISPPDDWADVDHAIRRLDRDDALVLTSANGVDALADRIDALGLDARQLAGRLVAVVGEVTADRLWERLAIRADATPDRHIGEALAEMLIERHAVKGRRFLLLRGDRGRPALPDMLRAAGGEVVEHVVYCNKSVGALPGTVTEGLAHRNIDYVTFTSSSTAENMAGLLGDRHADSLGGARLVSIGPVTSDTMRRLGWRVDVEADPSRIDAMVDTIVADAARASDGSSSG